MIWGYGKGYTDDDIHQVFRVTLEAGVNFFDTAEVYGKGRSERLLGACLKEAGGPRCGAASGGLEVHALSLAAAQGPLALEVALRASPAWGSSGWTFTRSTGPSVPSPSRRGPARWRTPSRPGLRAPWVYRITTPSRCCVPTPFSKNAASRWPRIRWRFSLLNRRAERQGLLKLCHELGVTLIAYSPIAKGMLTGKYTPQAPPPGLRGCLTGASA